MYCYPIWLIADNNLEHLQRQATKCTDKGLHLLTIATPHHRYPQFRATYCTYYQMGVAERMLVMR